MLAHELRNPLASIVNALGLMQSKAGQKQAEFRGVIERQTKLLAHIVDDLLDVSRITAGKISLNRSIVNLAESVERCLKTLEAGERMAGHVISVQSEEAWVEADSVRIDQILINLVGNALKYTPAGGSIDIRVRPEDDDSVVEIVDTGVGMSPDALAHAFDLFFQADRAPNNRYRTAPLRALWDTQKNHKGGFYHDGRFATLREVVDHYDPVLNTGLTDLNVVAMDMQTQYPYRVLAVTYGGNGFKAVAPPMP